MVANEWTNGLSVQRFGASFQQKIFLQRCNRLMQLISWLFATQTFSLGD